VEHSAALNSGGVAWTEVPWSSPLAVLEGGRRRMPGRAGHQS
jgi:hypothetical protein